MNVMLNLMSVGTRILIVDDDPGIRTLVSSFLARYGYVTETASNPAEMRSLLADAPFDLIVLDLMMPGEDGLTALKTLYKSGGPPVIMLSAVGGDIDRIVGLELGAEDYLAKPCNPRELLARIRTVLRRRDASVTEQVITALVANDPEQALYFSGWRIDMMARTLYGPGATTLLLSDGEFRLLRAFLEHPRRVLTRDQLLDYARGEEVEHYDRAIDVQISRLRRKLGIVGDSTELIRTVRNEGYMFMPLVSSQPRH